MKKIAILGSTGSIGENTLRIIAAAPERFQAAALAAGSNRTRLIEQIQEYCPRLVVMREEEDAAFLRRLFPASSLEVASGEEGLCRAAALPEAEVVVMAVAGAAAFAPTAAAIEAGKTIALANKESLVMAGELLMETARRRGARLLPVDSEHAGIFQALAGRPMEDVRSLILTASGGPFLETDPALLEEVTPMAAAAHPTWPMGKKISIDSATMMNKALELIEAHWLFGIEPERIEIVIHPEAVVHAMVEFRDGSVVAQMSVPDMRLPLLHALSWPERIDLGLPRLDFRIRRSLSFLPLDPERFPAPTLARRALEMAGDTPAVLAAADEAAVAAFLAGRIPFTRIVPVVRTVLESHSPRPLDSLAAVRAADAWARAEVEKVVRS